MGVGGLGQLLSALCACLLKAVRPDDDEDLDDEEGGGAQLRQPLLRGGEAGQEVVGGGSSAGGLFLPPSIYPVRAWQLPCGWGAAGGAPPEGSSETPPLCSGGKAPITGGGVDLKCSALA